jgi:hypothetical protein
MLQTEQGLDRTWLDCVVHLVICLDGAGFRPQAQHWLALAAPVGRRLGLMLREPLPMPAPASGAPTTARALWALGKLPNRGADAVKAALPSLHLGTQVD